MGIHRSVNYNNGILGDHGDYAAVIKLVWVPVFIVSFFNFVSY